MNGISKIIIDLILNTKGIKEGLAQSKKEFGGFKDAASQAAMESGNDFRKFSNTIGESGAKMASVGSGMVASFTVPIVGGLGLAINEARKFESSFAGVKKTVDATEQQFKELEDQLKKLSTVIPANVNDINRVAEAAGQLGIKYKDIEKFTEVMINLGVSTNLSADQAATQFARLQNIMGFAEDDFERLGSVVVDLGNNFATSESEIMDFAMRLAPTAKQMGMNTQEIMGISAAFTSMGITAEAGGTAISKLMSSMQLASDRGVEGMAKLEKQTGMSAREMQLLESNNSSAFKKMADGLGMTSKEFSKVIKANKDLTAMADIAGVSGEEFAKIFGEDAVKALDMYFAGLNEANLAGESAAGILSDMEVNEVRLRAAVLSGASAQDIFSDAVRTASDAFAANTALQEEADKRYATLDSQLQLMGNSFRILAINIGEQMIPYIKDLANWASELAQKLAKMSPKEFQAFIKSALLLAGAGPALLIVGKAFVLFDKSVKGITALSTGVGKLYTGLLKLGKLTSGSNILGNLRGSGSAWDEDMLESVGGKFNSAGMPVSSAGKFLPRNPKLVKQYMKENADMTNSTNKLGDASKAVTTSGLFTMAGFAGLFIYMKKAYDNSAEFRTGLQSLIKTGKDVGTEVGAAFGQLGKALSGIPFVKEMGEWATSMDGVINLIDVLIIAVGGLGIAFGFLNPALGIAAIAFGAFKILTSIKGHFELLSPAIYDSERAFDAFNTKVDSMETHMDRLAVNAIPRLKGSFGEIQNVFNEFDTTPVEESIASLKKGTEDYLLVIKEDMSAGMAADIAAIDAYYAQIGELGSESHKIEVAAIKQVWATKQQEVEDKGTEIMGLLEQYEKDKDSLNADELIKVEAHYRELELLALEHYTIEEEIALRKITDRLTKVRETGIALEGAHLEESLALLKTNFDKEEEIRMGRLLTSERLANTRAAQEKWTEEQLNHELAAIRDKAFVEEQVASTKHFNEQLLLTKGFDLEKIAARDRLDGQMLAADKEIATYTSMWIAARTREERDRLSQLQVDAESKLKLLKEEREGLGLTEAQYVEYSEMLLGTSEETQLAVARMTTLMTTGATEELQTLSGLLDAVLAGYDKSLKTKGPSVITNMRNWAEGVVRAAKQTFDVRSPSRVFRRIGNDVMDGMDLGLEDGADDVMQTMEDINNNVIGSIDPTVGLDVSRNVMTEYGYTAESKLADAVAKSVAKELSKVVIRAKIDEDDFNEGVSEAFRTEMSR